MWIIPFLGMEQKTYKHQPEWMGFLGHNYVFKLGFVLLNIRVSSNFAEKNHFPSPFRCYNPHVSRIFLGRSTSNQQVCRQVTQHHALFLFQSNLQRRRRTPVAALKATKDLRDVFLNVLIGCGQRCAPENQTWLARKSSRTIFWKTTKKKEKTQGELSLADFPASRGAKLEGMQVSSPHVHIILQYHVGTIVASI
jgi:hypothetical protein